MKSQLSNTIDKIQNTLKEEQLSKETINEVISLFLSDIVHSLTDNKEYYIRNFGTFYNILYPEKKGVNPINHQEYVSEAHYTPKFKFYKKIKDVVKTNKTTITTTL